MLRNAYYKANKDAENRNDHFDYHKAESAGFEPAHGFPRHWLATRPITALATFRN